MSNPSLFFPLKEGEDAFDKYEELLFQDKQFFCTKTIHPKVFAKRLEKMQLRQNAFVELVGGEVDALSLPQLVLGLDTESVKSIWQSYVQAKVQMYRRFYQAGSVIILKMEVDRLLSFFKSYTSVYDREAFRELDSKVLLSKEIDAMQMTALLHKFEQKGGVKPEDIFDIEFEGKESLLTEFKRLSLLAKLDFNVSEYL
jgi:hypothetical protein